MILPSGWHNGAASLEEKARTDKKYSKLLASWIPALTETLAASVPEESYVVRSKYEMP
jgi:hypothetical protein